MARPTISLQAAVGPGSAATDVFIIGSSLIGGPDLIGGREIVGQGSWEELGDRCIEVSTRRGRQRQLEQFVAGTFGALLDNTDGALDPTWTAGPYTDSGVSRLRPYAGVWLSANYEGVDYDIYTGFADSFKPVYVYPEGGLVELKATDAFKIFTRIDPLEQPPVGASDTTGARLNRILDIANWSSALRDIDTGNATHQETTLAQPIATQLRLAADSERGPLYINESGFVTARARLAKYTDPRALTVQWEIGDGASQMNPVAFDPIVDDELVYNDINVSRAGGTVITRQDPAVAPYPYLWSSYNRTDLTLEDDLQVTDYAEQVLRENKDARPRVNSVTFHPDGYDDLWPMILGARFGDRVTCDLTHPYTGIVFTGDYFIEGIDHDIPVRESGGRWSTTFRLGDATSYPTNPFIIGSSLIGGPDVIV
jgi:hypothetical protein